jgi:topoisomerase-4 subunit A
MQVSKVSTKAFFGKDIIHVAVWKKGDARTTYNVIYHDGFTGRSMVKRFNVKSITRDREYPVTKGTPKSKLLYFSANRNGEAEIVTVYLRKNPKLKKLKLNLNFSDISIKGRASGGNIVSKFPINRIDLKVSGVSTLGARKVWYDETVRRLNGEGRGVFLGEFNADDKVMALQSVGVYSLTSFDFSTHFDDKMMTVEKWDAERPVSAIYFDGEKDDWFVKRFLPELSPKPVSFITEHDSSRLAFATSLYHPQARVKYNRRFKHTRDREDEIVEMTGFITIKGVKALGNKLSSLPITEVLLEAPNNELELDTARGISEARRADDIILSETVSVSTEEEALEVVDIAKEGDGLSDESPETEEGQGSLF